MFVCLLKILGVEISVDDGRFVFGVKSVNSFVWFFFIDRDKLID